jgi:plastocyanin domain-containing protein
LLRVEHGVYQPAHIHLEAGQATSIGFERLDGSPCAEKVLFPDLEISEDLPVNRKKTVLIPPLKAGEYEFHCQMQMYRGKLIVSD